MIKQTISSIWVTREQLNLAQPHFKQRSNSLHLFHNLSAMEETVLHIGRKISRVREQRGWKQEALAHELGITQQAVSRIEQSENLEEATLERVAKGLGVPVEFIKNYVDPVTNNNTQNNYEGSNVATNGVAFSNQNCTIDNVPAKWLESLEEIKRLNAALLKEKDEKIALLQKMVEMLEKK
jgi:transcriptional regulator with XRE-family HTH domain